MKITFIGGGNMAQAIIGGLARKGYAATDLTAVEPFAEAREHVQKLGARACATAREAAPLGELVVMAVKPQQMREAAAALKPLLKGELVLSIAAGIRLADLSRWLGGHALLARCMPNTPALIGEGVSALYCKPGVSPAARGLATEVLQAVGKVVEVGDEALLDPVTAVSGSGPAYVFLFIEAMQQAAKELGLTAEQARALSIQTFVGAARLAAASKEDAAVLRERVTSKGGTTERALASMRKDRVVEAIVKAIRAADERSRELGDELGERFVISQIGQLLVDTLFGFFIYLLLLRFYMQAFRAPFRNPIGEFVTTLTNWIVRPARRIVPGLYGNDLATLLLAWLFEALKLWLLVSMRGAVLGGAVGFIAAVSIVGLLRDSLYLLIGIIFIQVILSWVSQYNALEGVLNALTRPFYRVFRRFIPPIGNIDLSPLFVLILAQVALILVGGLEQMVARMF